MKKVVALSLLIGVTIGAAVAWAQTTVYSANVVGFVSVVVPKAGGMVLAGYNFKPAGGDSATLKEIFGTNQLVKAAIPTLATRIFVWNTATASYTTYYQKASGEFYTSLGVLTTNSVIRAGEGFWIQSNSASTNDLTLTISGEVLMSNQVSRATPAGMMMIGNPFSADLDLNSTNFNWIADGAKEATLPTLADTVYIWTDTGYKNFFLKSSDHKWHETVSPYALATNAVIPVGKGAWYKAKGSFTNTLVRPYPAL